MRRWLDPGWYRYLVSMYPDRVAVAAIVALGLVAFGGYAAVSAMGGGDEPVSSGAFVPIRTTVMRTVEAYEQGRVVVKRPAVVKTIAARPVTVLQTSTIHTPGGTKVVTRSTDRTVKSVITTKLTRELTSTLTQSETQTATATATVTRTATPPSDTVTVTITVTTTKGP